MERLDVKQHAWAIPRLKPSLKKSVTPSAPTPDSATAARSSSLADARSLPKDGMWAFLSWYPLKPICSGRGQVCDWDTLHCFPVAPAGGRSAGVSSSSMIAVRADAEEYDPARPNDYNDVRDAREAQRKEAEQEAVRQERLKAAQAVNILGRGSCKVVVHKRMYTFSVAGPVLRRNNCFNAGGRNHPDSRAARL